MGALRHGGPSPSFTEGFPQGGNSFTHWDCLWRLGVCFHGFRENPWIRKVEEDIWGETWATGKETVNQMASIIISKLQGAFPLS